MHLMGRTETTGDQDVTIAFWHRSLILASSFALVFGALGLVWLLARPLVLLLIAVVIAQALAPIVGLLGRWLPRVVATIIVYLVAVGLVVGGLVLLLPTLSREGQRLVEDAPAFLERGRAWLETIDSEGGGRVIEAAQMALERFAGVLVGVPFTVFSSLIDFVLVIFMSMYWLIVTPGLHRFAMSLVPENGRGRAADVLREMGSTMGGFVRGTFIDALAVGLLAWLGFAVIGLEYAVLLAVVQGFGEIVPVVGPIIAAVPAVLVGLMESPERALIVLGFVLLLQQIESNILVPLVMRQQADIPPLLSLVAVSAGGTLGGLLGALVAIPLAGALRVLLVRVLAPADRQLAGIEDRPTTVGARPPDDEAGEQGES